MNHKKAIGLFFPEDDLLCDVKINTGYILQYLTERQEGSVSQDLK